MHLLQPANEVWVKVIFLHLSVILFTGGVPARGVPASRGCACSWGDACSRSGCLVETPPDGYCCGRYASYWNAFLFFLLVFFLENVARQSYMCELSLTFFFDQFLITFPFDGFLFSEAIGKQEYILVGCVPSALYRMVESLSGGLPDRDPLEKYPLGQRLPRQRPPLDRDLTLSLSAGLPDRDPPGQRPPGQRPSWTETPLNRDPPKRNHRQV